MRQLGNESMFLPPRLEVSSRDLGRDGSDILSMQRQPNVKEVLAWAKELNALLGFTLALGAEASPVLTDRCKSHFALARIV
jgi:hypothetical protein